MRVLFMGTPDFAVPSLEALVRAGYEVCGVFTQPDKPKNRGMKLVAPPVKQKAQELELPVYQPEKLRDGTALEQIRELAPELIVRLTDGFCPTRFWSFPDWAVSTSIRPCCPSTGGRPPSTGLCSTARRRQA